MLRHLTPRHVTIAAVAAFVLYAEYLVWIKSPMVQVTAICDEFRGLKETVVARRDGSFSLIDEAGAAEPIRLINKAVRACDGLPEAIDVEDPAFR